ncbi:MAG: tetratricopeptide repeat protein [Betaproteobacteria bacterium]|nr:tetratricopeptide repeat protein [Betaproteobacteria bacterium]
MAVYDLEEQERIDALKDWWESNRAVVLGVAGVVVASLAGYFGWQAWRHSQLVKAESLYTEFSKVADLRDPAKLAGATAPLLEQTPGIFHASSAALIAAKTAFEAKDFAAARKNLEWLIDKGVESLRPIARIRLAQVLLEEKKYDEALKTLDGVKEEAFTALVSDVKGDVHMAKGSKDEARLAWQTAVDKAGERSAIKQLSQIKLDSVGGVAK